MKRLFVLCMATTLCGPISDQSLGANLNKEKPEIFLVSNAHFDSQWNWDVRESIGTYLRNTLTQNIYLIENYPGYIFNFEGAVRYSWMKEYYPDLYEKMKRYVAQGRWRPCGSSWDSADVLLPSAESVIRNIMLGQHFFMEEFGVKSNDIFLPDCFGFGYTLPSLASHCGVIGFSTAKLQWRDKPMHGDSKVPFPFGIWQGIDGGRILAVMDPGSYGKRLRGEDITRDAELMAIAKAFPNQIGYRYYGTGDRGGSTDIATITTLERGLKIDGPLKIVSAPSDSLFKLYIPMDKHPELPLYDGELLMDLHATGCYTSQGTMKRYNRRNEQLADAAERASVIAEHLGGMAYPMERLTENWKRFVWHQFHDDLTGTSIPEAYAISWNDEIIAQSQFADMITAASGEVARALDTQVQGIPVVVFNSLSHARKEIVTASVAVSPQPRSVEVWSPDGKKLPAGLTGYSGGKAKVVFTTPLPSTGYAVFDVRFAETADKGNTGTLKVDNRSLENSVYKVTLDRNGDIASIVDKRNGRELVSAGRAIGPTVIPHNPSEKYPAWEIYRSTVESPAQAIASDVKISVAENNPARVALKIEKRYANSKFTQILSLTEGGADDRIDVRCEIDWRDPDALVKACFPLGVSNPEATYDLGLGSIRRGNNTDTAYEVYAHRWADLTDVSGKYGVSILSDCKYGWDKPSDNTLRLTLLHIPEPETPSRKKNYVKSRIDWGYHEMRYSIIGHPGNWVAAGTVRKAEGMNNPPYAFVNSKHPGELGRTHSMLTTSTPQVDVTAFKKAQSGAGYVVRVQEVSGKEVKSAELVFASPVARVSKLNGIEESIEGKVRAEGNKVIFDATPFCVRTFSVEFAPASQLLKPPKSTPLRLKYNASGISTDAFLGMFSDFDGKGNSYSFELLGRELVCDGVTFRFGDKFFNNYIKCPADPIKFTKSEKERTLYLLVASSDEDVKAAFTLNGRATEHLVPYYSGYYGQWGGEQQDYKGYVRNARLAWTGTHCHNKMTGNIPYVFTYMYVIAIPLSERENTLLLPNDKRVAIFAASVSENDSTATVAAADFRALAIK